MGQNLLTAGNGLLLGALIIAAVTDIRSHKIPNWLTFSTAILGVGLNGISGGSSGLVNALAGLLTGMALLIVFYAFGGMGAGDVKLMGAVGSFIGPKMVLWTAFYTAMIGGIYAVGVMLFHPYYRTTRQAIAQTLKGFIFFRKIYYNKPVKGPDAPKLCYGVAIAAGTVAAVILKSGT